MRVFTRGTAQGTLTCRIEHTRDGSVDVVFDVAGTPVKKQSIVQIERTESLADKPFAKTLYDQLVALGASAVWNRQVALHGDEPERIESALASAREAQRAEERHTIANTDIRVTNTAYDGTPTAAESPLFSWHMLQPGYLRCKTTGRTIYQMAYMHQSFGSDAITDQTTVDAVRTFWRDLRLLEEYAEQAYAKEVEAQEIAAEQASPLANLSYEERVKKAAEWDDIHNEGGEGFNPYR